MVTTVNTTTNLEGPGRTCQRKTFFAAGRFWVFYSDGSDLVYRTSTDGSTWSSPTTLKSGGAYGGPFSLWFDGTYMQYAYNEHWEANHPLVYRRGEPQPDGTISWSADEQTVLAADADSSYNLPTISVDTDLYPFISYVKWNRTTDDCYPYVTKSSNNDGTWSTDTDFPYQLSTINSILWRTLVVPMLSGRVYAIFGRNVVTLKGKLWDGSSWGSQETVSVANANRGVRNTSAVAEGDDIHVTFQKGPIGKKIMYRRRTYGVGWGTEEIVQDAIPGYTAPSLAIAAVFGDNDLYCFWQEDPDADKVYYKKCVNGTWDTDPTMWIDETTDDLPDNHYQACSYMDYGGKISFIYLNKTASPYNVRHDYISIPPVALNPLINKPLVRPLLIEKPTVRRH